MAKVCMPQLSRGTRFMGRQKWNKSMMMLIEDIETILTSTDPQHRSCDTILYDKMKRIKDYTKINLFGKLTDRNKIFLNAKNNQDIR